MLTPVQGKILYRGMDFFGPIAVIEQGLRRSLYFGDGMLQSVMLVDRPTFLAMEYSQAMMSALLFNPDPGKVLLVGLGGGSLVRFLAAACPDALLEVVEISDEVIRIAQTHFLIVPHDPSLRIIVAGGRDYVMEAAELGRRYDLLLVDAFDGDGPAATLQGPEFLAACRAVLTPGGIAVFNLWNRPEDRYVQRFAAIQTVFAGQALQLKLGESYRNAIVFGFAAQNKRANLNQLRSIAKELGQRYGLNFLRFLRELGWQNRQ